MGKALKLGIKNDTDLYNAVMSGKVKLDELSDSGRRAYDSIKKTKGIGTSNADFRQLDQASSKLHTPTYKPALMPRVANAAGDLVGNVALGGLIGASKTGATMADILLSPVDAVNTALGIPGWKPMHRTQNYDTKTKAALTPAKTALNTSSPVNQFAYGTGEFVAPLVLSGGGMKALQLAPKGIGLMADSVSAADKVADVAGVAQKALGGKLAGKAAGSLIKTAPDMVNTYAIMELPKPESERTPFPEWAAMWGATELGMKGVGAAVKKGVPALKNILSKSGEDVPMADDLFGDVKAEYVKPEITQPDFTVGPLGRTYIGEPQLELPARTQPLALEGRNPMALTAGEQPLMLGESKIPNWDFFKGADFTVDPSGGTMAKDIAYPPAKIDGVDYVGNMGMQNRQRIAQDTDKTISRSDIGDPAYIAGLESKYNDMINAEVANLKANSKLGVEQGGLGFDNEGNVVNRWGRMSNNPPWYRNIYAQNVTEGSPLGSEPRAGQYRDQAINNLIKGNAETGEPANDEFLGILSELSRGQKLPEEWRGLQKSIRDTSATNEPELEPLINDMQAEQTKVEPYGLTRDLGRLNEAENTTRGKTGMVDQGDYGQYEDVRFKKAASEDIDRLNGMLQKRVGPFKFGGVEAAPEAMQREDMQAADAIAKIFTGEGITPYKGKGHQGITAGRKIFINEQAKDPIIYVAKHEVVHSIETTNPELHTELVDIARSFANDESAIVKHYADQGYKESDIWEEFNADIMSEVMERPDFWSKMRESSPQIVQKVIDVLDGLIAKFKQAIGADSSMLKYVNDLEAYRDIVAPKVGKHLESMQGEQGYAEQMGQDMAAKAKGEGLRVSEGAGEHSSLNELIPEETGDFSLDATNPDIRFKQGEERSRIDELKDMVIAGARQSGKSMGFTDNFKNQMLKEFPQLNDAQLKFIYDRSVELRKGKTVIKFQGQEIPLTKADLKLDNISTAPAGKNDIAVQTDTSKQIAALKSHIANAQKAAKYDGNEPARAARVAELQAELNSLMKSAAGGKNINSVLDTQEQKIIKDINKRLKTNYDMIDEINNSSRTAEQKAEMIAELEANIERIKQDPNYSKANRDANNAAKRQEIESRNKNIRDISGFQAETQDVARNFRDFYGNDVELQEGSILDNLNTAKGANMDYQKNWTDKLKIEVVDKLGISKNTPLSKLVQQFGEGEVTLEQLKTRRPNDWQKVVEADNWFRKAYDEILTDVNKTIEQIYPGQPDKLVPKRSDYYRHFRDLEGFQGFKNMIGSPANISPELAGRSEFVRPNTKWASFKQQRGLGEFKRDAVGGFLDYLPAASYSVNIDPMVGQFRKLSDELASETSGEANTMVRYLQDYANSLAGKTSGWDRKVQEFLEGRGGSRLAINLITSLNNRAKANSVMLNPGSALSQLVNIPNGVAFAKQYSIPGTGKALLSIFKEDPARESSAFMKERFGGKMYRQFDTKILDQPKNFASWLIETADQVGTEMIWQSCYSKGLHTKAVTNPVKYADAMTKRLVAGRGIGETALIQKSKLFQVVAPFQVEIGNLWKVQKDFVKDKDFGAIATLYVGLWLANNMMEKTRGQRIVFDPINAIVEATQEIADPENSGREKAYKAGGRLAGEVLSNVPLGQTIAAAYPEYGNKSMGLPTRKELFGSEDPTRYGTGPLVAKAVQDPVKYLIFPYGGAQVDKTWKTAQALYNKGAYKGDNKKGVQRVIPSLSVGGDLKYPVAPTAENAVKGLLFGPGAMDETKEYYDKNRRPLSGNQTTLLQTAVKQGASPEKVYENMMAVRERNTAIDSLVEEIKQVQEDKSMPQSIKNNKLQKLMAELQRVYDRQL